VAVAYGDPIPGKACYHVLYMASTSASTATCIIHYL
jgi:hypothetical protein